MITSKVTDYNVTMCENTYTPTGYISFNISTTNIVVTHVTLGSVILLPTYSGCVDTQCVHTFITQECIPVTEKCEIKTNDMIKISTGFYGTIEYLPIGKHLIQCNQLNYVQYQRQEVQQQRIELFKRRKWYITDRFKFEFRNPDIVAVAAHVKIGDYERYFDRLKLDSIEPWIHDVGFCPSVCLPSSSRDKTPVNKQVSLWLRSRCRSGMFVIRPSLWIHPDWSLDQSPDQSPDQSQDRSGDWSVDRSMDRSMENYDMALRSRKIEQFENLEQLDQLDHPGYSPGWNRRARRARILTVTLFGYNCDESAIIVNATQSREFYVKSEEEFNYIINVMLLIMIITLIVLICFTPIIKIKI